ncbi:MULTISPECIES: AGE family epimerase/isomerase [unclassified Spirosoma]|uniref:AGE family epimerase/isomerase n=1 Tax=unclassified Spirosoma TaxID=2621999 RepID=UPI000959F4D0|nr:MULTISPECIES: AGE family epimerase/isomerase [unclassified Spirosoma]MBN8824828.1 AGE family epimerase/isomerase [Spirosoma sp.]OJW77023.1 MAG: N-acyl-D-glucosamine 2-epimerase [Spirosoma sp. 48-14]
MLDFQKLSAQYQQALLRQVVPFWLKHSLDVQCGGYFDGLTATGGAIDGDKSVIVQAQQTWAFSWLYNTFDGQTAWLDHARHGAMFLSQSAHDDQNQYYAQLDRRGRPVAASADFTPDAYILMAYVQLFRATAEDEWEMLAKQIFSSAHQRRGISLQAHALSPEKYRQTRHLAEALAFLKATMAMQPLLDEESWKQATDAIVLEILQEFVDRRTDTLREYILPDGGFLNTPEGRRLNVGLTFQAANYLLDLHTETDRAKHAGTGVVNRKVVSQVVAWCQQMCEQGWDETSAGLNQYIDFKGQPIVFPESQQKWAWVHAEALSALLKCYYHTNNADCLKWFKRIHDYTFQYFPDPKATGWHLVIDSQGQPLIMAKAIPTVGCYSLIRCLTETAKLLLSCEPLKATPQPGRSRITLNS